MVAFKSTYPYKILSTKVPTPPPWAEHAPLSTEKRATALQWKPTVNQSLPLALKRLQFLLRTVHKRKIAWPIEDTSSSTQSPKDYMMTLLRPIADIFNQLHSPEVLTEPMECIDISWDEFIYGATFKAKEFEGKHKVTPPIVICLVRGIYYFTYGRFIYSHLIQHADNLFSSRGEITSRVNYALSRALEYNASTSCLIVSNFREIVLFFTPTASRNPTEPVFEKVSTTDPPLALRAITAAYVVRCLPEGYRYINVPDYEPNGEIDLIGPPQDPRSHLLSDEEVFATHHRHSDFDFVTLVHDRARALQFFRWKEHVQQTFSKAIAQPGDALRAITNEVGMNTHPTTCPLYPYDASELPPDTRSHLQAIQRQSPLGTNGTDDFLKQSKAFTLKIESVVSEGTLYSISTVYRCQITSIDGSPVSSSTPLCLKLFDDRFQPLDISSANGIRWFDRVLFAQHYALNEVFAYEKLQDVQGAIIPWFYGMHQFTLPDGTVLHGLLLEFVEGGDLQSTNAKELSIDVQVQMIKSCRHAARILDVADICQLDWATGQILLHATAGLNVVHAVLIDFASTYQTWDPDKPILVSNYSGVFGVLLNWFEDVGFNPELVWQYFGEPDDWDPITTIMRRHKNDKESTLIGASTLFPFILF